MIEEIQKDLPIPLYYQLMQILRKNIENGYFKPGAYIPTEEQLQEKFGVSRSTVRKALLELVHQGYLERRRSKGTIVAGVKLQENLQNLCSFTEQFISNNVQLITRILSFKTIQATEKVANNLQINLGDSVHFMERLRMIEEVPVAFERWYAPENIFPGLSDSMFSTSGLGQSTYFILFQNYGLKVTKAEDLLSPTSLKPDEARILCVDQDVPALLRTRISFDSNGVPVNYGTGVYLIKIKMNLEIK